MTRNRENGIILKILPYLSIIFLLIGWQLVVVTGMVPNSLLASPTQILATFIDKLTNAAPDGYVLWVHTLVSLEEAVLGYILALLIGIPLGLFMGWFSKVDAVVSPIFELIRPIPAVAWIPLTIFWFGIGLSGKVFIIFLSGLVACVINSYTGVKMTNQTLIRMAKTYGASNWEIFCKIVIPSALPMIFGGLQVALAASWTALVSAELIAANSGLGYLITMGRRVLRVDIIMLGMVMVALTGAFISLVVQKVEDRFVKGIRR